MDVQYADYEIQANVSDEDGATVIEAIGEVWGTLNDAGRVFVPGAFRKSIRRMAQRAIPMGWMHEEIVGKWTKVRETADDLRLMGRVSQTGPGTLEHRASVLLQDGALTAISIGFVPTEMTFASPGERMQFTTPSGEVSYSFREPVMYVQEADLKEASLVMVGAQSKALVVAVQSLEKASRALPVLQHLEDPTWDDAAYSMALLMGGRGAAAFVDLPDDDHFELYRQIAASYEKLEKTAPAYSREPIYQDVAFQHDERGIFQDRYLRKNLSTAVSGARGIQGQLSPETRQVAQEALDVLGPLAQEKSDLAESLRAITALIPKGATK